jgi:hypothetical protein
MIGDLWRDASLEDGATRADYLEPVAGPGRLVHGGAQFSAGPMDSHESLNFLIQRQVHRRVHKRALSLWRVFAEFGEQSIGNWFNARPMPRSARADRVSGSSD